MISEYIVSLIRSADRNMRAVELCNAISRYTHHEAFLLAERTFRYEILQKKCINVRLVNTFLIRRRTFRCYTIWKYC